jgi:hypothetical protein
MYLHLGSAVSVPTDDIIGIFDLDNVSTSPRTRAFLKAAEEEGMVFPVGEDLPKTMVVCCPEGSWQRVYLSPLSSSTLHGRLESVRFLKEEP